jgi:hypothetical protein
VSFQEKAGRYTTLVVYWMLTPYFVRGVHEGPAKRSWHRAPSGLLGFKTHTTWSHYLNSHRGLAGASNADIQGWSLTEKGLLDRAGWLGQLPQPAYPRDACGTVTSCQVLAPFCPGSRLCPQPGNPRKRGDLDWCFKCL